MAKPWIHALSSVKRFGGKPEDYLPIHNWFDETKGWIADCRHRAIRHHSQGIFECEKIFGVTLQNSDGKTVSVRDVAEMHVLEDFAGRFIPSAQDYLQNTEVQEWMIAGKGEPPPSFERIAKRDAGRVRTRRVIKFGDGEEKEIITEKAHAELD